ncbi:hypothetical protein MYX06_03130 [Patescibacteria group bacterium AH-259-L05]|nr:hypothetical protein [Patescibacteria group bacterium AH-259-L05]
MSKRTRGAVNIASAVAVLIFLGWSIRYADKQSQEPQWEGTHWNRNQLPADDQSSWEWKVHANININGWLESYLFGSQESGYLELWYGRTDDGMSKMKIYTGKDEFHNLVCRSEDGVVKEMGNLLLGYPFLLEFRDNYVFRTLPDHIQDELRRAIYSVPDWLEDEYEDSIPGNRQESTPIYTA